MIKSWIKKLIKEILTETPSQQTFEKEVEKHVLYTLDRLIKDHAYYRSYSNRTEVGRIIDEFRTSHKQAYRESYGRLKNDHDAIRDLRTKLSREIETSVDNFTSSEDFIDMVVNKLNKKQLK